MRPIWEEEIKVTSTVEVHADFPQCFHNQVPQSLSQRQSWTDDRLKSALFFF